jgi:hypothetical protein
MVRRLQVGGRPRFEPPALPIGDKASRFEQSAEYGRRHERTSVGRLRHDFNNLGRHRPGHRFDELANIIGREFRQPEMSCWFQLTKSMVARDLFRAKGDHQYDVRISGPPLLVIGLCPGRNQLGGQFIGPLAIIENDHRGTVGRTQRVEKSRQGLNASHFAEGLRPRIDQGIPFEFFGQSRQCRPDGVGLIAEQ